MPEAEALKKIVKSCQNLPEIVQIDQTFSLFFTGGSNIRG